MLCKTAHHELDRVAIALGPIERCEYVHDLLGRLLVLLLGNWVLQDTQHTEEGRPSGWIPAGQRPTNGAEPMTASDQVYDHFGQNLIAADTPATTRL
jgi:hypothetical protein